MSTGPEPTPEWLNHKPGSGPRLGLGLVTKGLAYFPAAKMKDLKY